MTLREDDDMNESYDVAKGEQDMAGLEDVYAEMIEQGVTSEDAIQQIIQKHMSVDAIGYLLEQAIGPPDEYDPNADDDE